MATLGAVQVGQIVQRLHDVGVIAPERFLPDRQRPLAEWLGIGVATLGAVQVGQIVQRLRDVEVIGPERILPDRQGPLVERLGIGVASLLFVE